MVSTVRDRTPTASHELISDLVQRQSVLGRKTGRKRMASSSEGLQASTYIPQDGMRDCDELVTWHNIRATLHSPRQVWASVTPRDNIEQLSKKQVAV